MLEHAVSLAHICQRDFLRRSHKHRARERNRLRQTQLHIACPRRHINYEIIQVAPFDLAHELLHRRMQHRAAPDNGFVTGIEQANRHRFDAMINGRNNIVAAHCGRIVTTHHNRHVRAVNIRVTNANLSAEHLQRHREVDRNGGFAHAAFAGTDRDDVADAGDFRFVDRAFGFRDFGVHLDFDDFDAGDRFDGGFGLTFQLIAHRTGGRSQYKTKADHTTANFDIADHIQRHDVAVQIRVFDSAQCVQNYFFSNFFDHLFLQFLP